MFLDLWLHENASLFIGIRWLALWLQVLHAHLAPAHPRPKLSCFQGFREGEFNKLLGLFYCGQPKAVLVCEIVAGSSGTVALDERSGTEILQAGSGGNKRLTATFCSRCCVLKQRGGFLVVLKDILKISKVVQNATRWLA